ncbi:acyl-CoA N-acyltransferase [Russula ochroleuca]|jgi:peptide alpha-N-acetyltransferase|uniref:Acyl-CoA N-acyltransferase n=1 Tax=Russula ochroleuca TaxID=152965 RepID=A0A9P5TDZ6_9AGAM|nr:acyl-CoA N-acyltransferase [Russula ochroleuca]
MDTITYRAYSGEHELPYIISLVQGELSEPYVVYTYRYFLHQWPHLSFLAYAQDVPHPVGVIVCKQSPHRERYLRGYIAMLSVDKGYRKRGIASTLVRHSISVMQASGAQEIALETEFDNTPALGLYTSLGFVPEKRLHRFYLNGKDAFRLVLPLSGAEDAAAVPSVPSDKQQLSSALLQQLPPPHGTSSSSSSSSEDEDEDAVDVSASAAVRAGTKLASLSPAEDEEDYAENTAKLVRLRRRVAALRACRMITVWPAEDDEDRVSGR